MVGARWWHSQVVVAYWLQNVFSVAYQIGRESTANGWGRGTLVAYRAMLGCIGSIQFLDGMLIGHGGASIAYKILLLVRSGATTHIDTN